MNKGISKLVGQMPGARLVITGHSLGAALAVLLTLEVQHTLGASFPVELWAYGLPRVGNKAFADYLFSSTAILYRVTNKKDIIPHTPPQWFGFRHPPLEMWVQPDNVVKQCDGSGEDPTCSDGICKVFCSISDHLSYFGLPMGIHSC